MANGTYGTIKPSLLNINLDVDIYYNYRPTRNSTEDSTFTKIENVTEMLSESECEVEGVKEILPGMFNLKLPLEYFNQVGIYTVYIKPKEMKCQIQDIGALSAYPDIRGIVVDKNSVDSQYNSLFENGNLVGYMVQYLNDNGERQEEYRLITTNNLCQPVSQNLTSSNTNSNGYRFNDSSNFVFITLTPSSSPSFKSNATPFIGSVGQTILISNTKFSPVSIEIEMVEHDIETLTTAVEGNQIRTLDKGLVTTYNKNGEIYLQQEFFTLKDSYTGDNMYEVRKKKTENIDFTASYDDIMNG